MTPNEVRNICHRMAPVGSRRTCSPAPTDTDDDYLVLAGIGTVRKMRAAMPKPDNSARYAPPPPHADQMLGFESFRHGQYNYIVTTDGMFFDRFFAASSVAKRLNLLYKADRVALFQAVLYGNPCT